MDGERPAFAGPCGLAQPFGFRQPIALRHTHMSYRSGNVEYGKEAQLTELGLPPGTSVPGPTALGAITEWDLISCHCQK